MPFHITGGKQPGTDDSTTSFDALNGDEDTIRLVDPAPDGGALVMTGDMEAGRPILPDHVPTKLERLNGSIKTRPLLDFNRWNGITLVPQAFKDILEELEPNTHQFFPMEYFEGSSKIGEGYLFIFCKRLDTLHDTACWPERDDQGFIRRPPRGEKVKIVFSKEKIAGHHAWVDKFNMGRRISDEFAARLQALNLTGLNYDPMQVA
ncbi:imm11 family protein [Pseudovibrio sp. Ad37]|uniref:imm11 family protein n=1 Tax=Pseudovibrio sp. Ad37 TaxID=989422 RepID=UPI0007AE7C7B|nr:DUF1629 domain-containing protein [Pseudovibrio sp. Ad37]KZL26686.1 hypothetical protein PsAD37_01749 [Pseudovibrio sp. Ad37]